MSATLFVLLEWDLICWRWTDFWLIDSKMELLTDMLLTGITIDLWLSFEDLILNALPPPEESTAEAPSMTEMSSLSLFRSDLKVSEV